METTIFDYAIIGGGCFGVSGALALRKEYPQAKIILFEGNETQTASKDVSKIIRTPYPDDEYILLAKEAKKKWENDPLYRDFYHPAAWIQVIPRDNSEPSLRNPTDTLVTPEDFQHMVGSQSKPRLGAKEELWLNEDIAFVDSALALEAVAHEAAKLGVTREITNVSRVVIKSNAYFEIEITNGQKITAKRTILATGAWTPALLKNSNIQFPQNFFTIAAVGVATIELDDSEYDVFKKTPIVVTEKGEIMPPGSQQNALKITSTETFEISHPDDLKSVDSINHISANQAVLEKIIPQFQGRDLYHWICADLITPYEHPLIDHVPGVQGLYIAAGGSYHSYKFLPLLGDFIVRCIGDDRKGLLKRWSWNRSEEKVSVHGEVVPKVSI